MSIDLSSYSAVETALFVKIECDYYRAAPGDTPTPQTLLFSDYTRPITLNGDVYPGLGKLLGITGTDSSIRTSAKGISVTISGIPDANLYEVINSRFKGSRISVYRLLLDPNTHQPLAIAGNPTGRFFGLINNFGLDEDHDVISGLSSNTITFTCSSQSEILGNKIAGRRTNSADQKTFFPTDISMDRVATLANSNFNFGAEQ